MMLQPPPKVKRPILNTTAAISALGSQLRTEMQQNTLNIIGHMAVIPRPTSGTATAAA